MTIYALARMIYFMIVAIPQQFTIKSHEDMQLTETIL